MSGPTVTPERPAPPARPPGRIDPRIRERRAQVLRGQARRRLRVVLTVVVAVAMVAGTWGILHTKLFSARVVTVVGAVHTPEAAIVAAAGLSGQPPMIDVSGAAVAGVERLPWVLSATVSRQWPDGVRITVVERAAVADVALAPPAGSGSTGSATSSTTTQAGTAGYALLDKTGRVLADVASAPPGLVQVAVPRAAGAPGTTLAGAGSALRVATSLPTAFKAQVTEVVVSSAQDLTLQLTSPVTVDLGSTADLAQKYEDVAAILAGATLHTGDMIDVSAPRAPTLSGQ